MAENRDELVKGTLRAFDGAQGGQGQGRAGGVGSLNDPETAQMVREVSEALRGLRRPNQGGAQERVGAEGEANLAQGASSLGVLRGDEAGQRKEEGGKEEGGLRVMPQSQGALRQAQDGAEATGLVAVERLHVNQRAVLELLMAGKSVAETARVAGVSRGTVYKWLKDDAAFRAAHNQWLDEMEQVGRTRMVMLTEKAVEAVKRALEAGDGRLGMRLLEKLGVAREEKGLLLEEGEVAKRMQLDRRKRELAMEAEERRLGIRPPGGREQGNNRQWGNKSRR